MGDLKVVLVVVAIIALAVVVISKLIIPILACVAVLAIARMLVRQSSRKDEAHSPGRNRPGTKTQ